MCNTSVKSRLMGGGCSHVVEGSLDAEHVVKGELLLKADLEVLQFSVSLLTSNNLVVRAVDVRDVLGEAFEDLLG